MVTSARWHGASKGSSLPRAENELHKEKQGTAQALEMGWGPLQNPWKLLCEGRLHLRGRECSTSSVHSARGSGFSKKSIEYESDLRLPTRAGLTQGSDFLSGPAPASGRGHRAGETGPALGAASFACVS